MDDEYYPPAQDLMCARADTIMQLAMAADSVERADVRKVLMTAIGHVMRSIDLPRGQLVEVPKTAAKPSVLKPVA